MKRNPLVLLSIVLVLALIKPVLAASISVSTSSITFGGSDAERDSYYTATLTITNTGSDNVTININPSGVNSRYQLSILPNQSITIPGNNNQTIINLQAYIPKSEDSAKHKIGNLIISGSGITSQTVTLYMQAVNKLEVYDMDIEVAGSSQNVDCTYDGCSYSVDKKAEPGSSLTLTIKLKNDFTKDENIDINDIEINSYIENINNGDDLYPDREVGTFDLAPEKKVTKAVTFTIPENAEEDEYTLAVEISGEDDNGAVHSFKGEIYFEVKRPSHAIDIVEISPSQLEVSNCSRSATLAVKIINRGRNDEKHVAVTAANQQLGIGLKNDLSLNYGESYTNVFTIIAPQNAVPGTYMLTIKTYYDYDELSSISSVPLVVKTCAPEVVTPTEPEQPVQNQSQQESAPVIIQPPSGAVAVAQKVPFTETTTFMVLLVVAIVALLILIFVVIAKLVR
ncbi:MAG: hypothetical protein QXW00_02085 [Candidatus Woesearchaeota archaeon]